MESVILNWSAIIATILNGIIVTGLGASIALLWRTSVVLERVQVAQTAHEKADNERFVAMHQRLDDFREEFRETRRELR